MSASVINVTRRAGAHRSWIRRHAVSLAFLAPAAIWLLFIVVWPTIDTVRLSLFNESATKFLGLTNYKTVFSTDTILTAFRNNVIWVLIFPFFVTTFGLIFAVLTERIRWATAFKALIVMPIVFSTTASALVWATIFDNSPQIGAVNAAALTVSDWFNAPGAYPVSTTAGQTVADLVGSDSRFQKSGNSIISTSSARAGGMIDIGLRDVSPTTLTVLKAQKALKPQPMSGAITGVVWRAFSPTAPTNTKDILAGRARSSSPSPVAGERSGRDRRDDDHDDVWSVQICQCGSGKYFVELTSSNFSAGLPESLARWQLPDAGVGVEPDGPGTALGTPRRHGDDHLLLADLGRVCDGADRRRLASLNREVLKAARIDGAKEWQVFRRVTVPMLSPVLAVVFVTMIINVLKVFDIVLNMASGSSVNATPTLAVEIYNEGFHRRCSLLGVECHRGHSSSYWSLPR